MKICTQNFKDTIPTFGREFEYKFTINDEVLTGEELLSVTPLVNTQLLKSIMKELDFESKKEIPLNPKIKAEIGMKVDNEYEYLNYGNYIVYKQEYSADTQSYKYTCYDKMLLSMITYENLQNGTFPMTIREYITNICKDLGFNFEKENDIFPNYNRILNEDLYANLNYTYRDIFDEISEVVAGNIAISENDNLTIKYPIVTHETINENYLNEVNVDFGEKYGPINSIVLSRSSESDNIYLQDKESIKTNGLCEFKISDNQIMNFNDRSDYLPDILEKLNGLTYYINDYKSIGIMYLEVLDIYNISIGSNIFQCLMLNDEQKFTSGLSEDIYTELPEESVTDYTVADTTDKKIRNASIIVNKQLNQIQQQVSDYLEVAKNVIGIGNIKLENASNTYIGELHIKGQISLLYPNDVLYPSDNLYSKNMNLIVESGENKTIYELPINYLNYLSNDVADEFIIKNQQTYIIRRVGTDENGNKIALENEIIEPLENVNIQLFEGDNTIYMSSFDSAIFNATYMIKNEYTDTYATKIELNAGITNLSDEINIQVSKKVDNDDVINAINLSTEGATINAEKIGLQGKTINLTADDIDIKGNNLDINSEGNISLTDNSGQTHFDTIDRVISFKVTSNVYSEEIDGDNIYKSNIDFQQYVSADSRLLKYKQNANTPRGDIDRAGGIYDDIFTIPSTTWYSNYDGEPSSNVSDYTSYTKIDSYGIETPKLTQTSLAEKKKDFEIFENALELIKNTDVYKYHLKFENKNDKKHIGLVIGENYKTPREILSNNEKSVDLYSLISVCLQAIKEQQEEIEKLKEMIKK